MWCQYKRFTAALPLSSLAVHLRQSSNSSTAEISDGTIIGRGLIPRTLIMSGKATEFLKVPIYTNKNKPLMARRKKTKQELKIVEGSICEVQHTNKRIRATGLRKNAKRSNDKENKFDPHRKIVRGSHVRVLEVKDSADGERFAFVTQLPNFKPEGYIRVANLRPATTSHKKECFLIVRAQVQYGNSLVREPTAEHRELLAPFSNGISDEPLVSVTLFAGRGDMLQHGEKELRKMAAMLSVGQMKYNLAALADVADYDTLHPDRRQTFDSVSEQTWASAKCTTICDAKSQYLELRLVRRDKVIGHCYLDLADPRFQSRRSCRWYKVLKGKKKQKIISSSKQPEVLGEVLLGVQLVFNNSLILDPVTAKRTLQEERKAPAPRPSPASQPSVEMINPNPRRRLRTVLSRRFSIEIIDSLDMAESGAKDGAASASALGDVQGDDTTTCEEEDSSDDVMLSTSEDEEAVHASPPGPGGSMPPAVAFAAHPPEDLCADAKPAGDATAQTLTSPKVTGSDLADDFAPTSRPPSEGVSCAGEEPSFESSSLAEADPHAPDIITKRLLPHEVDDYLEVPDWTDKYNGQVSRLQTAVECGLDALPDSGVLIKSARMSAKTGEDVMFHVHKRAHGRHGGRSAPALPPASDFMAGVISAHESQMATVLNQI